MLLQVRVCSRVISCEMLIGKLGSEAFQPDPLSWRLSTQPLAKVGLTSSTAQPPLNKQIDRRAQT